MSLIQQFLKQLASQIIGGQIHQHQMIVRAARYDPDIPLLQSSAQRLRIVDHALLIFLKGRLQRLLEADSLCCDHVHERAALRTGENSLIEIIFICHFLTGHDHAAARAAECLVCRRRSHVGIRNRTRMQAGGHKSRDMGDIHHQHSAHFISDLPEFLEINGSCIGRCA